MTKTFLRWFYVIFLWIILMANLLFAFDLVTSVLPSFVSTANTDFTGKYFGVSTLINAFRSLSTTPLGKLTTRFLDAIQTAQGKLSTLFPNEAEDWPQFANASNFFEGLREFLKIFVNIGKILVSIWGYIFAIVFYPFYFLTFAINFVWSLLMFLGGYYYSEIPRHIWQPETADVICNCITPLISAV